MLTQQEIESGGWKRCYTQEMKSIIEVRKAVNFLSSVLDPKTLFLLKIELGISYVDLKGNTDKEKVIFLIDYCRKEKLLNKFFKKIVALSMCQPDYFDKIIIEDIQNNLNINLMMLNFDIPHDKSCLWRRNIKGNVEVEHNYEIREYRRNDEPCKIISICQICGKKVNEHFEHKFEKWKYNNNTSCIMTRHCINCSYFESKTEHDISDWITNKNGSKYRICSHCKLEEQNIIGKWEGIVKWENGNKDFWRINITTGIFDKLYTMVFSKKKYSAEIEVFINHQDNHYDFKVIQKGIVKSDNGKCRIICEKVIQDSEHSLRYSPDTFEGNISHGCSSIQGIVYCNAIKGTLTLE